MIIHHLVLHGIKSETYLTVVAPLAAMSANALSMSEEHIRRVGNGSETVFYYDYGTKNDHRQNYTYDTRGNPMAWKIPQYSVE